MDTHSHQHTHLPVPYTSDEDLKTMVRAVSPCTVNLTRVPHCGHKLVPGGTPRHANCTPCWFAFFQTHGEVTQVAGEVFGKFGGRGLAQIRGKKFARHFAAYTTALGEWEQRAKEAASV